MIRYSAALAGYELWCAEGHPLAGHFGRIRDGRHVDRTDFTAPVRNVRAGAQNIYYLVKTDLRDMRYRRSVIPGPSEPALFLRDRRLIWRFPSVSVSVCGRTHQRQKDLVDDAERSRMYGKDVHIQKCHFVSRSFISECPILARGNNTG